jgi:hypothetical protein
VHVELIYNCMEAGMRRGCPTGHLLATGVRLMQATGHRPGVVATGTKCVCSRLQAHNTNCRSGVLPLSHELFCNLLCLHVFAAAASAGIAPCQACCDCSGESCAIFAAFLPAFG